MGQYRKKPVIVEAYQTDTAITIHTLEGDLKGEKGDWIITGLRGEQYPCKPDIFEETYEAVEAVAQEKSLGEQIALDAAMCLGYILRGTTALFLLLLSLRFWADVLHTGLPEGKTAILGTARATAQQMALFCRSRNAAPRLPACSVEELAQMFLEEGAAEGVRGDVAWAQSLKETGFFRYGGIVLPEQNNYAGIGALNGNAQGQAATFPDPRIGVRAQIQHLKAYACTERLANACVDPRFPLVTRGCAPYVEWLGAADNPQGKGWAFPGQGYGESIVKLLGQILAQETPQSPAPSPEPEALAGFPAWQRDGLAALQAAGVIDSPDYWAAKFSEGVTVGELFGILGKMAGRA